MGGAHQRPAHALGRSGAVIGENLQRGIVDLHCAASRGDAEIGVFVDPGEKPGGTMVVQSSCVTTAGPSKRLTRDQVGATIETDLALACRRARRRSGGSAALAPGSELHAGGISGLAVLPLMTRRSVITWIGGVRIGVAVDALVLAMERTSAIAATSQASIAAGSSGVSISKDWPR